jgi:hypothetical protein
LSVNGSAINPPALLALIRAANEHLGQGTFTFAEEAVPYADVNRLMAEP